MSCSRTQNSDAGEALMGHCLLCWAVDNSRMGATYSVLVAKSI